ncbi:ABC transporter substrate-binding protein, partial [Escherichia coli]
LHSTEARLKKPLPEIRALLTQVPVAAASSEDPVWLAQFDNKSFAEQQMMEWQLWFLNNQRLAIKKLEELK